MILTVGNLKGGVGKTTLAVNIAVALGQLQREVLLVDAEGTAITFTDLRASQKEGNIGYTAVALYGAAIRTQIRQLAPKYSDIVIDIGGEDATGSLRAALTVADTIILPIQPRSFDLWRTEQTFDLIAEAREINESLRAIAVLNVADFQGRDNQETLEALAATPNIEVAPTIIGRRKAFPNAAAAGLSVIEWTDAKAAEELRQLVAFITA